MLSNARKSAPPCRARNFVIAAVRVVLPWSTWPIVPTLTCGLVLSYFCLAIVSFFLRKNSAVFTAFFPPPLQLDTHAHEERIITGLAHPVNSRHNASASKA